jgi:glutamine amidotransferase
MSNIVIINYGMGNLGSIENMIRRVGGNPVISSSREVIAQATKLILPGVGYFAHAVTELKRQELWDIIDKRVKKDKVSILCICLGAQLALAHSEEGDAEGFGWIKGEVVRFNLPDGMKIPHMGWNNVMSKKKSRLFESMYDDPRFYFVHSYYFNNINEDSILTTTVYGHEFVSSLEKENIFAVQFHPEKSHKYGMKLFENFINLV